MRHLLQRGPESCKFKIRAHASRKFWKNQVKISTA